MTPQTRRRSKKKNRFADRGARRRRQVETKQCARCLEKKPLDEFGENHRMKLGRKSYCLGCSAELQREWRREQSAAEKSKRKR